MDYSSLPNDPDHPIGSSPWQSSPQPTSRPFTASEASSAPSSPLAKHSSYRADSSQETEREGSGEDHRTETSPGEDSQSYGAETVVEPEVNGSARKAADNAQPPPGMEQPPQIQQQQKQQSRQPQQQQQRITPNRYHGGAARQSQRQNLPQYKLQAKITSLERTGRKDPILRFDVHVSSKRAGASENQFESPNDRTDESPKIPHHSVPRR